jgi:nucleoside-diphosphate-sugar epimerase
MADAGWSVRALVRPAADVRHLRGAGVGLHVGDVLQADSLVAAVRDVGAVIHLAGAIRARSEEVYRRIHVDGTMNLLDVVERHAPRLRRFVLASSIAAAGPAPASRPIDEDAPARPVGAYGRTKLEAEAEVLERKERLAVTVFRPPIVYGPRDRQLLPLFRLVRAGLMVMPAGGELAVSVVHAADLAAAMRLAVERDHPSGSVFFVTDGPARRYRDLAEAIRLAQATPAVPVSVSRRSLAAAQAVGRLLLRRVGDLPGWVHPDFLERLLVPGWACSDARVRAALGWTPSRTILEGLVETVDWYRQAGWLAGSWGMPLNPRRPRPSKPPPETRDGGNGGVS